MRLTIRSKAAEIAFALAIVPRGIYGLLLDAPLLRNGAWISALIGGILVAPLLAFLPRIVPAAPRRPYGACAALLALLLAIDSFRTGTVILRSAGFLAFDRDSAAALILPVCLLAWWCIRKNGDAIGYYARLFAVCAPLLFCFILPMQLQNARAGWLFPLFGYGYPGILRGGIRAAGWFTLLAAIRAICESKNAHGDSCAGKIPMLPLCSVIVLALLVLLQLALSPSAREASSGTWLQRLDILLTNGRIPMYTQLPLTLLWFGAMIYLFVYESFLSAALLQRTVPRLDGKTCAIVLPALIALAFLAPDGFLRIGAWMDDGLYPAATVLIVLFSKGGAAVCEER